MPHRPVILGIVGDSAAGKTTISTGIANALGRDRVTLVCTDDYHRYNREERKKLPFTALHPECNYVDIMEQHLRALAEGQPILKPVYDHHTGDFAPPEYVRPEPFVIVEGLLAFHTQTMRDCFHAKVYLDPPEALRRQWKVKRDCAKRGYASEQVLAELEKREPESAAFIRPQKQWADLVVRFHPPSEPPDQERLDVQLTLRPTLPHPDLSEVARSSGEGSAVRLAIGRENGRLAEFLEIDGCVQDDEADAIEQAIWTGQPELQHLRVSQAQLGGFVDGTRERRSHPLALTQAVIAYHLLMSRLAKEQLGRQLQQSGAVAR